MCSVSVRIRLRGTERRDDNAVGKEMQTMARGKRPTSTVNAQHRTEKATISQPSTLNSQLLFGIVQGATFEDLRKQSAQAIVELDFDGYAVGGISVGEPGDEMMRAVELVEPFLPE